MRDSLKEYDAQNMFVRPVVKRMFQQGTGLKVEDGLARAQVMTTPEPSGALSGSLSITTDGASGYWAVGSALTDASVYQTFTLRCP